MKSHFESAGDAIYILKADSGRILNCNSQACLDLGYNRDELVKLSAADIECKLSPEEVDTMHYDLKPGELKTITGMHKRKDGSVFPVEIHLGSLSPTQSGLMIAVARNIAERRKAGEEKRRSQETLDRMAEEMAIIAKIGRVIGSSLNIDEVYERFAFEARKLIPFDRIVINLIDDANQMVKVAHISGMELPGRQVGDCFPLKGSANEYLVRTGVCRIIQPKSFEEGLRDYPFLSGSLAAGLNSLLGVPLISRDKVIGGLHFRAKKPNAYTDQDLRLAERIGAQIAGAIANAQLYFGLKQAEEELKGHQKDLEKMIKERTSELEIKNITLQELNTTLKVLLKQREDDRNDMEERFVSNVQSLVLPFVEQLKKGRLDARQQPCLEIIEAHLHDMTTPLVKNIKQFNLTPKELKVAALVRNGRTTKQIAEILSLATGSIDIHRNNIRKKLGLNSRKANLQSHLGTLEQ